MKPQSMQAQSLQAAARRALLQKDLPWMLGFLIAGTIALSASIAENGFLYTFVLQPGRWQAAFFAAWITGLVLGLVAASYDTMLGAREFLQQRPIAAVRLAGLRVQHCLLVVAGCMLLSPFGAWLGFLAVDQDFEFGYFGGLSSIWGSTVVMASATAIGLFAASLPVHWLLRLFVVAAAFTAVFVSTNDLANTPGQMTDPVWFVGMHVTATVVLLWAARGAMTMRADADRPWTSGHRYAVAGLTVGVVAVAWSLLLVEAERAWVWRLRSAYPELMAQQGQGQVVLVRQQRGGAEPIVVGHDHAPTGTVPMADLSFPRYGTRYGTSFPSAMDLDAPMWRERSWQSANAGGRERILLSHDGVAWIYGYGRTALRRTGKGSPETPFAPGSRLLQMTTGDDQEAIAQDGAVGDVWRFAPEQQHFVPLPLPDNDRLVAFEWAHKDTFERGGMASAVLAALEVDQGNWFARGERHSYLLRQQKWVPFTFTEPPGKPRFDLRVNGKDPMVFEVVVVDASPELELEPFRHTFEPRTTQEHLLAFTACALAAMRLPVLQVGAHAFGNAEPRHTWLVDPLVTDGRRSWLVAASVGLAIVLTWRTRRRLRACHAAAATVRFWTVLTLLFGPVVPLLSLCFEPSRAYARRALPGPFPAPRIVSSPVEETVA